MLANEDNFVSSCCGIYWLSGSLSNTTRLGDRACRLITKPARLKRTCLSAFVVDAAADKTRKSALPLQRRYHPEDGPHSLGVGRIDGTPVHMPDLIHPVDAEYSHALSKLPTDIKLGATANMLPKVACYLLPGREDRRE